HWIDNEWKLKKILLDICMHPHPYTGQEINTQLCSVFATFNITNKILCATTDSGSNMELKEIGQLVDEGEATRKIPQDGSTRWNSMYLMLAVYITMSTMIAALIRCNNNLKKYKLTPQEESDLQAVTQFLKPFYETTNVLSGSTYTTLGVSIVLMDSIVDTISLYLQNPTSPEFLKAAATQMSTKVQKYTNKIYDKTAFMAAILDPRVKLELMPEHE
ncbi:1855_t:CDS:2, partial [Gigaspora margarita]